MIMNVSYYDLNENDQNYIYDALKRVSRDLKNHGLVNSIDNIMGHHSIKNVPESMKNAYRYKANMFRPWHYSDDRLHVIWTWGLDIPMIVSISEFKETLRCSYATVNIDRKGDIWVMKNEKWSHYGWIDRNYKVEFKQ